MEEAATGAAEEARGKREAGIMRPERGRVEAVTAVEEEKLTAGAAAIEGTEEAGPQAQETQVWKPCLCLWRGFLGQ